MNMYDLLRAALPAACVLALTACGGSSPGEGVAFVPPPPPPPPPAPTSAPGQPIVIFDNPATQEFATLGPGGSTPDLRIRYDSVSRTYEVLAEGDTAWKGLRPHPDYESDPNHFFAFGPTDRNEMSFLFTAASYRDPPGDEYDYSNIAIWGEGVGAYWDDTNYTAFGIATPQSGVPVAGSASYNGTVLGTTDYRETDFLIGDTVAATISGTIQLNFNFGSGTLDGSMRPTLDTFGGLIDLGTFAFRDTVYSAGANQFSGRFDTAVAGTNAFGGMFAGQAAQEVFGHWSLPFVLPANGQVYGARGAFIAKQ